MSTTTPATTIAETTESARRMVEMLTRARNYRTRDELVVIERDFAAALAQAMVDAALTPEQVERMEQTVGRYFE